MSTHVIAQLLESDILGTANTERFRSIIAREGADLALMRMPGAQLPIGWFREAYPTLDAEQAAYIGYSAGEQACLTSYGFLSLPLVSASSVSEVMNLLVFLPLLSNVMKARFEACGDTVLIMLSVDSGDELLDRIPVFYSAAALVQLLRLLSDEAQDISIHIAWPMPVALAGHPEVVSGRLRFDAPMHFISVPRTTLAATCRFADPVAYQSAVASLQAMLDASNLTLDAAGRVRRLLDQGTSLQRIDQLATALNLSVSTLKRRLAECGTNFSDLQAEALCDRARLMLMDTRMSLDDVAASLGYSDLSNFSHAFKRWTGIAPGEFRRTQLRTNVRSSG